MPPPLWLCVAPSTPPSVVTLNSWCGTITYISPGETESTIHDDTPKLRVVALVANATRSETSSAACPSRWGRIPIRRVSWIIWASGGEFSLHNVTPGPASGGARTGAAVGCRPKPGVFTGGAIGVDRGSMVWSWIVWLCLFIVVSYRLEGYDTVGRQWVQDTYLSVWDWNQHCPSDSYRRRINIVGAAVVVACR